MNAHTGACSRQMHMSLRLVLLLLCAFSARSAVNPAHGVEFATTGSQQVSVPRKQSAAKRTLGFAVPAIGGVGFVARTRSSALVAVGSPRAQGGALGGGRHRVPGAYTLHAAASQAGGMDLPDGDLSPAQVLERIRQQRQNVGWAERFAASFAPKSSAEEFKLNWVGNIDRHQRELFWRLITMLCDRIDPYLRWMRVAHDIIQGAKVRFSAGLRFVADKLLPTLFVATLACSRRAVVLGREALLLSRIFMLRACSRVGKGALALVGVGVALPPPSSPHAAKYSVGPAAAQGWWRRRFPRASRWLTSLLRREHDSHYATSSVRIVRSVVSSGTVERRRAANKVETYLDGEDSVLFPTVGGKEAAVGGGQGGSVLRTHGLQRGRLPGASGARGSAGSSDTPGSVLAGGDIGESEAMASRPKGEAGMEGGAEKEKNVGRLAQWLDVIRSVDIVI
jgi:hypothetical protein